MTRLTLRFDYPGEEAIVRHALAEAYARVMGVVEDMRAECPDDDLPRLVSLADMADHARERCESMHRGCQRALARMDLEDDPPADFLPGVGRSPAVKGQGCPASAPGALPPASAVGPAAGHAQAANITCNADPLFAASGMQKLPPGDTSGNTQESGEANYVRSA